MEQPQRSGEMGTDKVRQAHFKKLLERPGRLCHPEFVPSTDNFEDLKKCKILVIGAGGLGCELLKDLALLGFRDIHVIDMDTIDLSNLNRQLLFKRTDIGEPKATVAARVINSRIPGCLVTPHHNKIQDFDQSFYGQFNIVVCGLDSVDARLWINEMLLSLLLYDGRELDTSSIIPLIDGGTEGFKGNARVILHGLTACIECTLDLFPKQVTYPICTIANNPRLPEHCIEYVRLIQWPKDDPFNSCAIDGDSPEHCMWIYQQSLKRAEQYKISGVTPRLVQGVIKNILPAVSSTNAVLAGICATEVFKLATSCYANLNNYLMFNDVDGIYTHTYKAERREDCPACGQIIEDIVVQSDSKLEDVLTALSENPKYQMKNPGIRAEINGDMKTLYMTSVKSIEEQTRANLKKSLEELGLHSGTHLYVADVTKPKPILLRLQFAMDEDCTEDVHNDKVSRGKTSSSQAGFPDGGGDPKMFKKMSETSQELKDLWRELECPVCFEIMAPPIFICENGHDVCVTCRNKSPHCAICESARPEVRNITVEAIVELIPLPCPNAKKGCDATMKLQERDKHDCLYGPRFQCVVDECKEEFTRLTLVEHLKKTHGAFYMETKPGVASKVTLEWGFQNINNSYISVLEVLGWGTFLLRLPMINIVLVGSDEDANKLKYNVDLNVEAPKVKFSNDGDVASILSPQVADGSFSLAPSRFGSNLTISMDSHYLCMDITPGHSVSGSLRVNIQKK